MATKHDSELARRTRELIKTTRKSDKDFTYAMIAALSGVTETWLKAFAYGSIPDPSVGRIEAIYNVLAAKPLFAE